MGAIDIGKKTASLSQRKGGYETEVEDLKSCPNSNYRAACVSLLTRVRRPLCATPAVENALVEPLKRERVFNALGVNYFAPFLCLYALSQTPYNSHFSCL